MEKRPRHHQLTFTTEERNFLDSKFGCENRIERQEKIKEFLLRPVTINQKPLADQLKEQQILSLKLKNQILLVHDLEFPIEKVIEIIAKPEIFDSPKLENSSEPETSKLSKDFFCEFCSHTHFGQGTLHNCKECNCGVRG